MSEDIILEVGQTWVGSDWRKTLVRFNLVTFDVRTQSLESFGSDYISRETSEKFLRWIERSGAILKT